MFAKSLLVLFVTLALGVLMVAPALGEDGKALYPREISGYLVSSGLDLAKQTPGEFIRGDANADSSVSISDVVHMSRVMFDPGYPDYGVYLCKLSFDANDDEAASISDIVHLSRVMFDPSYPQYGVYIPPHPGCGIDPTPGALPCGSFPPCGW